MSQFPCREHAASTRDSRLLTRGHHDSMVWRLATPATLRRHTTDHDAIRTATINHVKHVYYRRRLNVIEFTSRAPQILLRLNLSYLKLTHAVTNEIMFSATLFLKATFYTITMYRILC